MKLYPKPGVAEVEHHGDEDIGYSVYRLRTEPDMPDSDPLQCPICKSRGALHRIGRGPWQDRGQEGPGVPGSGRNVSEASPEESRTGPN